MRKTLTERCKSTHRSMKARAKKDGCTVDFTAEELETRVPTHCPWCHDKITPAKLNIDHEIPISRGGSWSLDNMRGVCDRCNRRKGPLTSAEYRIFLKHLREAAVEIGDPTHYAARNILMRLAAGGAFIYR